MAKNKIGMRWKGSGFFVGVPARDLTIEEVERYGRDFLLMLGLYEEVEQPKPKRVYKAMQEVEEIIEPPQVEEPEAENQNEEDESWHQE